jgi:hypothetical protein
MGRVRRAVIQSRVHIRYPGLPRTSRAESTCVGIYLWTLPALRHPGEYAMPQHTKLRIDTFRLLFHIAKNP